MRVGFPNWLPRCTNASQQPTSSWWTGWSGHSNITQPQPPTPSSWAMMWPSSSTGYRSENKLRLHRTVTRLKFEYVYLQSGSILCKMYSWVKIISLKKFASPFLQVACIFSNNMFVLPLSLWLPTNSFAPSEEILFLFSCNICCSCIKHNFKIILWWSYKGLVIWQKYHMILKGTKCIMIYRLAHKRPTIQ